MKQIVLTNEEVGTLCLSLAHLLHAFDVEQPRLMRKGRGAHLDNDSHTIPPIYQIYHTILTGGSQ